MVFSVQFLTDSKKTAKRVFNKLKKEKNMRKLILSKTHEKTGRWMVVEKISKEKKKTKSKSNVNSKWYDTEDLDFLDDLDEFYL